MNHVENSQLHNDAQKRKKKYCHSPLNDTGEPTHCSQNRQEKGSTFAI